MNSNFGPEWLATEIKKRYGNVTRSRGCYLYTEKGVRLTDCYLDNGRAILGWDGGKARTVFKNLLERGATGCYDSGYNTRLVNAVKKLLPAEYTIIRWWKDETIAAAYNERYENCKMVAEKNAASDIPLIDPDIANSANSQKPSPVEKVFSSFPVLWRPWIDITATSELQPTDYLKVSINKNNEKESLCNCFQSQIDINKKNTNNSFPAIIQLTVPFPWAGTPSIYAFHKDFLLESHEQIIPSSDVLPAPLIGAMARSFSDLILALGTYSKSDFSAFSKLLEPFFERQQCYLYPKILREKYPDFVLYCLEAGIVLSPDYDIPSIIPWKANKGDIKKISQYQIS